MDKSSLAFQRGKRSCTISSIKSYKPQSILLPQGGKTSDGKKSVGAFREGSQPSLLTQAEKLISGDSQLPEEYDFCHHCKQLKNKYLLVSCKYSTKMYRNHSHNIHVPYPYEPQLYTVNNVKIFNCDMQNRLQIKGLIESTKKELQNKNRMIETVKPHMQKFTSQFDVYNDQVMTGGEYSSANVDITAF